MRVRAGLVTAIYQKALVLSNDGRSSASGDIVNLMSVDAMRLQDLSTYCFITISGPFQVGRHPVASSRLANFVRLGHIGVHIPLQHLRMAGLRRSGDHDPLNPAERVHRQAFEENAGIANEEQRQAHKAHERALGKHQEVSFSRYGLADAHIPMFVISIKLYAWENAFIRKILFVRNEQEMKMLRKIGIVTVR